jgi:RNA polymerase-binding transcription factor DksA
MQDFRDDIPATDATYTRIEERLRTMIHDTLDTHTFGNCDVCGAHVTDSEALEPCDPLNDV